LPKPEKQISKMQSLRATIRFYAYMGFFQVPDPKEHVAERSILETTCGRN